MQKKDEIDILANPLSLISFKGLRMISNFVWSGTKSLVSATKTTLVGNLNIMDLNDIAHLKIPSIIRARINGGFLDGDDEIESKSFGLVGDLLFFLSGQPINVTTIKPHKEESYKLVKNTLKILDNTPGSRELVFNSFEQLSGNKHFIAHIGLERRKHLLAYWPSTETIIQITKEMIDIALEQEETTHKIDIFETLVNQIFMRIFMGDDSIERAQFIDKMTPVLTEGGKGKEALRLQKEFKTWLEAIIDHKLSTNEIDTTSSLGKMIEQQKKKGKTNLSQLKDALLSDSTVTELLTILVPSSTVASLLTLYYNNPDAKTYRKERHAGILREAEQLYHLDSEQGTNDSSAEPNQDPSLLKCIYMETLSHRSSPGANQILRFAPQAIKMGEKTIPRNSVVVLHTRVLEKKEGFFNPSRFISPNPPVLNTPSLAPFSVGTRSCLGHRIVKDVVYAVIARMALRDEKKRVEQEMKGTDTEAKRSDETSTAGSTMTP